MPPPLRSTNKWVSGVGSPESNDRSGGVRHQRFWFQRSRKLSECPAHLVGFVKAQDQEATCDPQRSILLRHRAEQRLGEVVALQKVAEVQDGRLVGDAILR